MGDRTFALAGKGSQTVAALYLAIGVVFGALSAAIASLPDIHHRAEVVVFGIAVLAGCGAWSLREHRRNRGPRRLTVGPDALTIEHPGPLRAPLVIPRGLIRAIALDGTGDPHARLPVEHRFSWSAPATAPDGVEGHLWIKDDPVTLLPLLGGARDAPTAAIVLRHPAAFDAARAPHARAADARTGRTTLDRERHVIGVMLAVEDPAALAAALADWPERVEVLETAHFRPAPPAAAPPAPAPEAAPEPPAPEPAPAPAPAPPASPLASVPPPAPRPHRSQLDLPRTRSAAATRRVALLVALGFAVPFALVAFGLIALGAYGLAVAHVGWAIVPGTLGAGMLLAVARRRPAPEGGVVLERAAAPALHAFVADVARTLDVAPPARIRLRLDPFDGIEAAPGGAILHLGLATLAGYDRDQLRALIAHELAHDHLRHTAVQRIVWRTFVALRDLDRHLRARTRGSRLYGWPAVPLRAAVGAYARFADPIALELERGHEVQADEVAARPDAAIASLERAHALGLVYPDWAREVLVPALEAGRRPPLAASFAAYLERPEVRRRADAHVARQRHRLTIDPHSTHPPLGVRLAIARDAAAADHARPRDPRPALALLDRLDLHEQELLADFAGADRVATLQPVQAAA